MSEEADASSISDEELLRRFQATGDAKWFAELFERHRFRIRSACRRFFDDASDAEGAAQETFLRALTNISSLRHGNVAAWLLRIARNVCVDQWRQTRRQLLSGSMNDVALLTASTQEPNERTATIAETVLLEMEELPIDQRRCLELKIAGYSYEDTALFLGVSVAAVKSHLQNGRRTLWRKLRIALPPSE